MLPSIRAFIGLCLLLTGASLLCADIRLPKIFSDKMVLQRGSAVRIWGKADPGEELTITLGENSTSTTADAEGSWSAAVVPPETGGPYKLSVEGAESSVVFSDVYVGEVWVCSGGANMQRSLKQSLNFADEATRDARLQEINNPEIRLFNVPPNSVDDRAPDFTEAVAWQECRGDAAGDFSATAYFFAVALQQDERFKDVPIGLINASWGGTPAEAWTSREALAGQESLAPMLEHWNDNPDKRLPSRPSSLFNGMIAPLVPLGIRGVIWYQGEANVGRGHQYRTIFSTLINDWRSQFNQGEIPFYYVQLAPHRYNDRDPRELPEVWDAQRAVLEVPKTAMAPSSDIGSEQELHPMNKEIVGQRLAKLALKHTYGMPDLVCAGPKLERMELLSNESRIRLHFANNEGLTCGGDSLKGFQISGENGEFKPATAIIQNGAVLVWAEDVPEPIHVRYLWQDTATASLFNASGLPAFPFRTDNFKLLSEGRHF